MIANTFLDRPVTAIVVSLIIVIVGAIAIYSLPVSQYPDITPPTVQISGSSTVRTRRRSSRR
jgi:HAE1 family hydrophobic/amphiphilic exporter-1